MTPWDHAAGVLIHKEAGGYAAFLDGRPYTVRQRTGGLLCAPDEESCACCAPLLWATSPKPRNVFSRPLGSALQSSVDAALRVAPSGLAPGPAEKA